MSTTVIHGLNDRLDRLNRRLDSIANSLERSRREAADRHELRLVAHVAAGGDIGIQPHCPCGWIGEPDHARYYEAVTDAYRSHLEEAAE